MLPGIGGSELVLIAIVALIVVGPKDLPKLLRQLGKFVAKMRSMADEFRASFDDMARQSELDDLRKEVEALRSGKSVSPIINDIREDMRRIETDINQQIRPPVGPSYAKGDDVPSPDAADASYADTSLHDEFGRPSVIDEEVADVEPTPKPARKPRKIKAEPEAVAVVDEAPKPKRTRAKPKAVSS